MKKSEDFYQKNGILEGLSTLKYNVDSVHKTLLYKKFLLIIQKMTIYEYIPRRLPFPFKNLKRFLNVNVIKIKLNPLNKIAQINDNVKKVFF